MLSDSATTLGYSSSSWYAYAVPERGLSIVMASPPQRIEMAVIFRSSTFGMSKRSRLAPGSLLLCGAVFSVPEAVNFFPASSYRTVTVASAAGGFSNVNSRPVLRSPSTGGAMAKDQEDDPWAREEAASASAQ